MAAVSSLQFHSDFLLNLHHTLYGAAWARRTRVISSGDPDNAGWTAVEIVFHEVSHVLILPIQDRLARALGDRLKQHRVLWHVVQFYVTGATV